jgi:hypothetical protein
MRALALVLLALLSSCAGCSERVPGVCCTGDLECARLGLPPGSANEYGCGAGLVCRDFYCVAEEAPDASELDATADAPSNGRCNPNAPFGAPTLLTSVNSAFEDLSIALTSDQLKAYLGRYIGNDYEIVTARRATVDSDFAAPAPDPALAALAAPAGLESYLYPTADDLNLYFRRDTTWFVATRSSSSESFDGGTGVYVDGIPLPAHRAMLSPDSLTLYYSSPSGPLRSATKAGAHYVFFNGHEASLFDLTDFALSEDQLTLYYSNFPNPDIYRTTRATRGMPFGVGLPVPNVNTTGADVPLYVSPDDCFLYIRAAATGPTQGNDIWVARRPL